MLCLSLIRDSVRRPAEARHSDLESANRFRAFWGPRLRWAFQGYSPQGNCREDEIAETQEEPELEDPSRPDDDIYEAFFDAQEEAFQTNTNPEGNDTNLTNRAARNTNPYIKRQVLPGPFRFQREAHVQARRGRGSRHRNSRGGSDTNSTLQPMVNTTNDHSNPEAPDTPDTSNNSNGVNSTTNRRGSSRYVNRDGRAEEDMETNV